RRWVLWLTGSTPTRRECKPRLHAPDALLPGQIPENDGLWSYCEAERPQGRSQKERTMHKTSPRAVRRSLVIAALGLGLSACASSEQWAEWRSHPTHFPSAQHLAFPFKNISP